MKILDPATESDVEHAKQCAARALQDPRATFDSSDMIAVFKYVQLLNWKIDKLQSARAKETP